MPWKTEDVDRLLSMKKHGATALEISRALNMTRNAVCGKIDRLQAAGVIKRPKVKTSKPGRPAKPLEARKAPAKLLKPDIVIEKIQERRASIDGPSMRPDYRFQRSKAWEALEGSNPVPLEKLGRGECKWPLNGPNDTHLFCGLPASDRYCSTHTYLSHPKT